MFEGGASRMPPPEAGSKGGSSGSTAAGGGGGSRSRSGAGAPARMPNSAAAPAPWIHPPPAAGKTCTFGGTSNNLKQETVATIEIEAVGAVLRCAARHAGLLGRAAGRAAARMLLLAAPGPWAAGERRSARLVRSGPPQPGRRGQGSRRLRAQQQPPAYQLTARTLPPPLSLPHRQGSDQATPKLEACTPARGGYAADLRDEALKAHNATDKVVQQAITFTQAGGFGCQVSPGDAAGMGCGGRWRSVHGDSVAARAHVR